MSKNVRGISVIVANTDKVLWSGIAVSVSSFNSDGPFDILAGHANFITLIDHKPITIISADKQPMIYNFKQAIIFVVNNIVKIYAEE